MAGFRADYEPRSWDKWTDYNHRRLSMNPQRNRTLNTMHHAPSSFYNNDDTRSSAEIPYHFSSRQSQAMSGRDSA